MTRVKCIVNGCNCDAEITQGKRRLTFNCKVNGHLNFQTKEGQQTLKNWMEKHAKPEIQASPDKSTASGSDVSEKPPENNPVKKRGLFGLGRG